MKIKLHSLMTKPIPIPIFKTLLALFVLWFAVHYFYHYFHRSYLDNQVFRKIEKEYCEKDAGLMVFVDKIDFTKDIVFFYSDMALNKNSEIVAEKSVDIRDIQGIFFNIQKALHKEKMFVKFSNTYGYTLGDVVNIYKDKMKIVKRNYLLDGQQITTTEFIAILPEYCLSVNSSCTGNNLTVIPAPLPKDGLGLKSSNWQEDRVVFKDYVISKANPIQGFDLSNNKLLFSSQKYFYGGGIGYSLSYNPYETGLLGAEKWLLTKECSGSKNPHAVREHYNLLNTITFLREHYGN